jgi:activator of HSP90 ATPase
MKTKSLRQSATLNASAGEVYDMLMNSKKHTAFSGAKATVSPKVGGKFSVFDGYSFGTNLELKAGKKIVQSWRATDWPEGHYSKVTFNLLKKGANKTRLVFFQSGIPSNKYNDMKSGWTEFYWDPMKKKLGK